MTATQTVTSLRTGAVLLVIDTPEGTDPDDIQPGTIWVRGTDGVAFTIKERLTTPGGDWAAEVAHAFPAETVEQRQERERAEHRAEQDAIIEQHRKADAKARREDRRYYVTGKW